MSQVHAAVLAVLVERQSYYWYWFAAVPPAVRRTSSHNTCVHMHTHTHTHTHTHVHTHKHKTHTPVVPSPEYAAVPEQVSCSFAVLIHLSQPPIQLETPLLILITQRVRFMGDTIERRNSYVHTPVVPSPEYAAVPERVPCSSALLIHLSQPPIITIINTHHTES